jgi:hypothetical protein
MSIDDKIIILRNIRKKGGEADRGRVLFFIIMPFLCDVLAHNVIYSIIHSI